MTYINTIKKKFVQQSSEDNCGSACLAMILNYIGKTQEAIALGLVEVPSGGLSLLQLQKMAETYGLKCKCVEMDLEFLKTLKSPLILHTVNDCGDNHFQVFYGPAKKFSESKYLIADPATQVHYVDEEVLDKLWISKAALYFEELILDLSKFNRYGILMLLSGKEYPVALILTIPFLGICVASFGVALTWLLQKGLSDTSVFDGNVIYALLALLFVISIFKNLFSFLRQYILIRINLTTNKLLTEQLIAQLITSEGYSQTIAKTLIGTRLIDIQKIQNAISAIISIVIADGTLTVVLLAGTTYEYPLAGLVNTLYIITLTASSILALPEILYQGNRTKNLSSETEKFLIRSVLDRPLANSNRSHFSTFLQFHSKNLNFAKKSATAVSKTYLFYECWGTATLIFIIGMSVLKYKAHGIDYSSFMLIVIETFLITGLMQKISTSFQEIGAGADAWLAHSKK